MSGTMSIVRTSNRFRGLFSTRSFARVFAGIDPFLCLVLGFSLFALAPLFAPGYFYGAHDGRHSVFFVTMFDEAIRDGALWPRWAMHHSQGYGYPTFIIQAPLAFYLAEFFIVLGAGITTGVKLAWAAGFLASGWGMYALVRHWVLAVGTGADEAQAGGDGPTVYASLAGVVAGLLYVFIPYHLLDIYVRAALAETLLMAWFPWAFLAFDRLIAQGAAPGWQGRLFGAAVCFAGLLLTHVFALLAFTPLLIGFVLFRLVLEFFHRKDAKGAAPEGGERDRRPMGGDGIMRYALRATLSRAVLAATAGIAALLLAAVFVAPLLIEGPLLAQEDWVRDTYNYKRHWVHWGQFFSPFWGYGYSDDPAGAKDGMGFQVGLLPWLLAITGIYLLVAGKTARGRMRWLLWFLLGASVLTLASMTPLASWLWETVSMLEVIQFPWRLLSLTSFTFSALGGLVVWQLSTAVGAREQVEGFLVTGMLIVFASLGYARPEALQPVEPWREDGRAVFEFEQEHPDMLGYTRQVEERFTETPLTAQYAAADFSNAALERLVILRGDGAVLNHFSRGHSFGGQVEMATAGTVQIRVYEYPGWQVTLDGAVVGHRSSPPYGLIELDVPPGRHQIEARMGTTPVRTAGAAISGTTLLLLAGLWGWSQRRR